MESAVPESADWLQENLWFWLQQICDEGSLMTFKFVCCLGSLQA